MDQQFNTSEKKPIIPTKTIITIAVLMVTALFSFIVTHLKHHNKAHYTQSALSLPEIKQDSSIQDSAIQDDNKPVNTWQTITTQRGDTLSSIFKRLGLNNQIILSVLRDNPHAKSLERIMPNQRLQVLVREHTLETLIFPLSTTQYLQVSRNNNRYFTVVKSRETNSREQYVTATMHGSLYGTAKRMNIPYKLIQQMTDIFNWEIDFAKEMRGGDQFTIIYEAFFVDNKLVNTGDIVAVSYTNHGITHQAVRHENAQGDYDYYTPQGTSLKKAFSRYPVKFSHISSTFSLSRMHPILHYKRPHKGIDLAAPIGTPIRATGDGHIQTIGRQNAYGNMVQIVHNKTYSSLYAHLLKFQKGLAKGDHVKRGQIIGYVGQSGLADGPHCHYEFHVNQSPRNPSTIELPRAAPVPIHEAPEFKATSVALLNRLKLYEEAHLASNNKKPSGLS